MSVNQPFRGTMQRQAIQFELKEMMNDTDPDQDMAAVAAIILKTSAAEARREKIIGGYNPDTNVRYTSEEYSKAVEPLRPLSLNETSTFLDTSFALKDLERLDKDMDGRSAPIQALPWDDYGDSFDSLDSHAADDYFVHTD